MLVLEYNRKNMEKRVWFINKFDYNWGKLFTSCPEAYNDKRYEFTIWEKITFYALIWIMFLALILK